MESWNHSFKVDHGEQFPTRDDAKQHVFDYIEVYYNRKRLHSKLGYLSPRPSNLKMSLSKVSAETGQDQKISDKRIRTVLSSGRRTDKLNTIFHVTKFNSLCKAARRSGFCIATHST